MKKITFTMFIFIGLILLFCSLPATVGAQTDKPLVYTVTVENTVTAGTYQHINRAIKMAEDYNASALVILLNTPGGLVNSTLDIIKVVSGTNIPVITYVTPSGGIAASAGTFILLSGHIAAMSPGTTCGAAMPITMATSGESPQAADQKTINFLAAHMKTVAEDRGRSGSVAASFVTENLSIDAKEALEKKVIEFIAPNIEDLLIQVNGIEVRVNNKSAILSTLEAEIVAVDKIPEEKVFGVISDPTIAVILLMLGIYGLIIGFSSPGFLFPEVLGSICLILGLLGMGTFEINIGAGLLILLGIGLLIAEVFTPTYGVLAAGGVVSIVLGILFVPIEPMMPSGWFTNFKIMAVGVGLVGAGLIVVMLAGIWRLRKIRPMQGDDELAHLTGLVIGELNPYGQIRIRGEIWNAVAGDQVTIAKGEEVQVVSKQAMLLVVKPKEKNK